MSEEQNVPAPLRALRDVVARNVADHGAITEHDMTCGTCGRTWSSTETPTPAARCPFEELHTDEEEESEPHYTAAQRVAVTIARAQAIAYVWGRQDAAGEKDTGYSLDFGRAYAETQRRWETEEDYTRPNIERAYVEWRDHERITLGKTIVWARDISSWPYVMPYTDDKES